MHRSLVPIQVWLTYLLEGGLPGTSSERRIPSKVIGVILTAMYMVVKGKIILKDAMAWKIAASRFWQNIVSMSKKRLKSVVFFGTIIISTMKPTMCSVYCV